MKTTAITVAAVASMSYNQLRAEAKNRNLHLGKNPKAEDIRHALEMLIEAETPKARTSSPAVQVATVSLASLKIGEQFRYKTSKSVYILEKLEKLEDKLKVRISTGKEWSDKLDAQVVKVEA